MYLVRVLVALLAARLLVCAPTEAQLADEAPVDARPDEGDERSRALALYEQSRHRYELGDYEGAAALLRRAYAMFPEANLLYNLARAYGNLGDFGRAIDAYEQFLEAVPDTELRDTIEARIANYRQVLTERRAQERARERRLALELARREAKDAGPNPAPWILAGGGGGVLVAGAILGGLSLAARNDAEDDPSFRSARDTSDRAVALGWAANGAFVLGGLLTAIGLVWGIVDVAGSRGSTDEEPPEGLSFTLGADGATLTW